jgi:hypothetical protein
MISVHSGPDPIRSDARGARRRRRLGSSLACALCGESDPVALTLVTRRLLEVHHVAGRRHDPELTVLLCLNCHARATEALAQAGVSMRPSATLLDQHIAIDRALAAFHGQLVAAHLRRAAGLEAFKAGLDADYPEWHKKPWARAT